MSFHNGYRPAKLLKNPINFSSDKTTLQWPSLRRNNSFIKPYSLLKEAKESMQEPEAVRPAPVSELLDESAPLECQQKV